MGVGAVGGMQELGEDDFPVPRKVLAQLDKAFPVSHPMALLRAQEGWQ